MSYLDLARRLRRSEPDAPTPRLDLVDCAVLIRETFEAVEADYVDGALALLDSDPELCHRFHLAARVAVIHEACERQRARQAARAEQPDPMPELPADTVAAVGVSYGDGKPGTWDVVRRGQ